MPHRLRAFRATAALILWGALAAPAAGQRTTEWEVTFALRLTAAAGGATEVRVALPPSDERQTTGEVDVKRRGLKATVVRDGPEPHVLLQGSFKGSRRVAIRYRVVRTRRRAPLPPVPPIDLPSAEVRPFLKPTRFFQSRSIMVREFLETYAAPLVDTPEADVLAAVYAATRDEIEWARDGKSLTLDVIRRRRGKRIGIERAFTTFLRCARIPARFVEGVDLDGSTRRKRIFWTEVWADGAWWPVSASRGWRGRLPISAVALSRDGVRVVRRNDAAEVSYTVVAERIERTEVP